MEFGMRKLSRFDSAMGRLENLGLCALLVILVLLLSSNIPGHVAQESHHESLNLAQLIRNLGQA